MKQVFLERLTAVNNWRIQNLRAQAKKLNNFLNPKLLQ